VVGHPAEIVRSVSGTRAAGRAKQHSPPRSARVVRRDSFFDSGVSCSAGTVSGP
jgi:hypothetical protein